MVQKSKELEGYLNIVLRYRCNFGRRHDDKRGRFRYNVVKSRDAEEAMIVHKTFSKQTTSLTGQAALDSREKLRKEAEEFIANEINEGDVINITETAMTPGGLFSVTIWYRAG